ncbi:MAG: hypothetical protein HQL56_01175 [Magnetococcales bacterium]|nr:hypothetical protein [Magnetococcales bacterium]
MFNVKQFRSARFVARTADIDLSGSGLAEFFQEGSPPVWKVRGLTGEEMAICRQDRRDAIAARDIMGQIRARAEAQGAEEHVQALAVLSKTMSDGVPDDHALYLSYVQHGSVAPVCPREMAVKLAANFPVEFMAIAHKILELTGLGTICEKK